MEAEKAEFGDIADDVEEALDAEPLYSDYVPRKFSLGRPHPDVLVESASLAACTPPDVRYQLHLPQRTIDSGVLSSPQLEAICYAAQIQEEFLLPSSDSAGGCAIRK